MPINASCTHCSKSYTLDDAVAGKKVRCKACGNIFVAGNSAPKAAASKPAPIENDLYGGLASAAKAEAQIKNSFDDSAGDSYDFAPAKKQNHPAAQGGPSQDCPACRSPLPPQQQVCMNCGYDRRSGQRAVMARPEPAQRRMMDKSADPRYIRPPKEFQNPGVQMIETIILRGATIFVATGIVFLVAFLPIYSLYHYNRYLNYIEEQMNRANYTEQQKERERGLRPTLGQTFGGLVVTGLALTVGFSCTYAGMMTGTRIGTMIRRCSLPDGAFPRQNATLMSAWVLFMLLVFISVGNSPGIGDRGPTGFVGFMSVFFGSFFMWVGWLSLMVVGLIGMSLTKMGVPLLGLGGGLIGMSIVGLIGCLVMFPMYWFIHRLRIVDALVGFAFMCIGFIVGSAVGGLLMFALFNLMPSGAAKGF